MEKMGNIAERQRWPSVRHIQGRNRLVHKPSYSSRGVGQGSGGCLDQARLLHMQRTESLIQPAPAQGGVHWVMQLRVPGGGGWLQTQHSPRAQTVSQGPGFSSEEKLLSS